MLEEVAKIIAMATNQSIFKSTLILFLLWFLVDSMAAIAEQLCFGGTRKTWFDVANIMFLHTCYC